MSCPRGQRNPSHPSSNECVQSCDLGQLQMEQRSHSLLLPQLNQERQLSSTECCWWRGLLSYGMSALLRLFQAARFAAALSALSRRRRERASTT